MAKNKKALAANVRLWHELCNIHPAFRYFKHEQQLLAWMRANSISKEDLPENVWELHDSVKELEEIVAESSHDKKGHKDTVHASHVEDESLPNTEAKTEDQESSPITDPEPVTTALAQTEKIIDSATTPASSLQIEPKPPLAQDLQPQKITPITPSRGKGVEEMLQDAKNSSAKNLLMLHFKGKFNIQSIGEELHDKSKWDDRDYIKAIIAVENKFKSKYEYIDKATGRKLSRSEFLDRLDKPDSYYERLSPAWDAKLDEYTNEELADRLFVVKKAEKIDAILSEEKDTIYDNPLDDPVLTIANTKYKTLAQNLTQEVRKNPNHQYAAALNQVSLDNPGEIFAIARSAVLSAFAQQFPKKAAAYAQIPIQKDEYSPIRDTLQTLRGLPRDIPKKYALPHDTENGEVIISEAATQIQERQKAESLIPKANSTESFRTTTQEEPTSTSSYSPPSSGQNYSQTSSPLPMSAPSPQQAMSAPKRRRRNPFKKRTDDLTKGLKDARSLLNKARMVGVLFNPAIAVPIIFVSIILYMTIFDSNTTVALNDSSGSSGSEGSPGVGTPTNPNIPGLTIAIDGPNEVPNGSDIKYTVTVTYNSSQALTPLSSIELVSSIPTGTTYRDITTGAPLSGTTNPIVWPLSNSANQKFDVTFTPTAQDINVVFSISARVAGGFTGGGGAIGALLPPQSGTSAEIDSKQQAAANILKGLPNLVASYQQAEATTGVPWQILAGIHYREGDFNSSNSLVSGRPIGQIEPDIPAGGCSSTYTVGQPIAMDGGCGFRTFTDSLIYAAEHFKGKLGNRVPTNPQELVVTLASYNGVPGNSNCHWAQYSSWASIPGNCPAQYIGEDNPYVMGFYDTKHENMYTIYCRDGEICPYVDTRLGTLSAILGIVRFY